MKPTLTTLALTLALATAGCNAGSPPEAVAEAATPAATDTAAAVPPAAATPEIAAPKLQADVRALWHGHVVRTREYAMAVKAKDKTKAAQAAAGVVANATSIADAIAGFYGPAAGKEMLRLLGGHWGGVKALTDAQLGGDKPGVQKAMNALMGNGGEIAKFLAGANPNLPEDAVLGLLVAHVGHHAAQLQQIATGDTAGEVATWTAMQAHMDVLADALAGAIAQQFPDQAA
ncbi:MAG: hypothetical protein ACYC42_10165 [Lysobacter sp.]